MQYNIRDQRSKVTFSEDVDLLAEVETIEKRSRGIFRSINFLKNDPKKIFFLDDEPDKFTNQR